MLPARTPGKRPMTGAKTRSAGRNHPSSNSEEVFQLVITAFARVGWGESGGGHMPGNSPKQSALCVAVVQDAHCSSGKLPDWQLMYRFLMKLPMPQQHASTSAAA